MLSSRSTGQGKISFDHDSVQAFRGCANRRRQPGRTSAHDGYVENLRFINFAGKSQALSQVLRRAIALHGLSAANHNRYFVDLHIKTIEQFLSGVTVEVDICVRLSVAGEKLATGGQRDRRPDRHWTVYAKNDQKQRASQLVPQEAGQ